MDELLDKFERFVFDLDGTLWHSEGLLPYAPEVLARIRQEGKSVAFVTNSPMRTSRGVAQKLSDLGIPANEREVVTAGRAVASYLRSNRMDDCTLYALSASGLHHDLQEETNVKILNEQEGSGAQVVVVGYDENVSFEKIRTAFHAIRAGGHFVATNRDRDYAVKGEVWPAGGLIVAGLEFATGISAIAVGKPELPMLEIADRILGASGPTLMVGDKLDSDIEGARRMGWSGALVLTGATSFDEKLQPTPDYVLTDLSILFSDVPKCS